MKLDYNNFLSSFEVVCNSTNNTEKSIAQNELHVTLRPKQDITWVHIFPIPAIDHSLNRIRHANSNW